MKTWSAFLRDVRPAAPSTPEPVLEHAVRRAAQRFCERTRAWIVELDPTVTRAGATVYDLELERNVELVRLESATFNGNPYAIWRAGETCRGGYVYTPDGKSITFGEPVAAGLRLVVRCAVKPGNAATGVDDMLFDRYLKEIALGAVADITGDGLRKAEFTDECNRIKTALWRGNAAIRPRARPSFF